MQQIKAHSIFFAPGTPHEGVKKAASTDRAAWAAARDRRCKLHIACTTTDKSATPWYHGGAIRQAFFVSAASRAFSRPTNDVVMAALQTLSKFTT
jgi:hypothetical protein